MQAECELSFITINYNGLADTCALIESIPFNEKMEVIVVDNASKNDEATVLANKYPYIKIVRSEENLGFAGGNNLGIKASRGKYLYFINNDTVLREDAHLDQLIQRLESSPSIGMVCPKIRFAWDHCPIQFAGFTPLSSYTIRNRGIGYNEEDKGQYNTAHPTPYAHGAAMMVKREAIEKAGMMPECYFLYYEELDWSMMMTRAGYEIWYEPASCIYHKESQSTGRESATKIYYITRNRLMLVKRNWPKNKKPLSYLYLIGVVGIKDLIRYTLKGRGDLVKATCRGIAHFINK